MKEYYIDQFIYPFIYLVNNYLSIYMLLLLRLALMEHLTISFRPLYLRPMLTSSVHTLLYLTPPCQTLLWLPTPPPQPFTAAIHFFFSPAIFNIPIHSASLIRKWLNYLNLDFTEPSSLSSRYILLNNPLHLCHSQRHVQLRLCHCYRLQP